MEKNSSLFDAQNKQEALASLAVSDERNWRDTTDDDILELGEEAKLHVDKESKTASHIISTGSLDRQNDVVEPTGWDLDSYKQNPVVLANHRMEIQSIIGKNVELQANSRALKARTQFHDNEIGLAALDLVESGIARAWSVGFRGREVHSIQNGIRSKCTRCKKSKDSILNGRDPDEVWVHGLHFTKQELLEYSLVAVPANADAVSAALDRGLVNKSTVGVLFDVKSSDDDVSMIVEGVARNLESRFDEAIERIKQAAERLKEGGPVTLSQEDLDRLSLNIQSTERTDLVMSQEDLEKVAGMVAEQLTDTVKTMVKTSVQVASTDDDDKDKTDKQDDDKTDTTPTAKADDDGRPAKDETTDKVDVAAQNDAKANKSKPAYNRSAAMSALVQFTRQARKERRALALTIHGRED